MKKVKINYNPYKMQTKMLIDDIDVCENKNYKKFKEFIEQGTPLQTWIEPIPYLDWEGFVNEIADPERNDEIEIIFSGRKIDFQDLQHAITNQNEKRSERTRIQFHYQHVKNLDDKVLSDNIDYVVQELESERFRSLVDDRKTETLKDKYKDLRKNYTIAKENDFQIVFAGVYSSGKSTLLNTLIRHNVLPTSRGTCTSKNCRIRHDRTLGRKISLTCYDENEKQVVEKMIFDNDIDCARVFKEINQTDGTNEKNFKESTMELGVDLSHLYPESVSEDKFTIVLIDTPGMDSAQSSKDGINRHADIALEAISMESKPMIILCTDANKYEDQSIGEFMQKIIAQSKEEGGGFNDRFLFLMNKCDNVSYNPNESAGEAKIAFEKYLTDSSRWNIKGDDEDIKQLAESASHFVPRVFMTSAQVAFAIQSKVYELSEEEMGDVEYDLYATLDTFKKKICKRKVSNYYLSEYCDIPDYRKEELKAEFENAIENEDEIRATELQCGIVSLESAIKDYIERYAYPVKVRELLETFEDILEDVSSFIGAVLAELKQKEKTLGKKEGERDNAEDAKERVEEKIAALKKAETESQDQLKALDGIEFDSNSLKSAIAEFRADIENDETILFLRSHERIYTGQKSREEVDREIKAMLSKIKKVFKNTLKETNGKLEEIKEKHDGQLIEIFEVLQDVINKLEESEVFKYGEFQFENSVLWKMNFAGINSKKLASDMEKTIVDKTTETKSRENSKKRKWQRSWNPFKRIGAWFMEDYEYYSVNIDGYYETKELRQEIGDYLVELDSQRQYMQDEFEKTLEDNKEAVKELISKLLGELGQFLEEIKEQKKHIEALGNDIEKLSKEVKAREGTHNWLVELEERIKGE